MEKLIWRLLTAIFLLLTAIVLGLMAVLLRDVAVLMGVGFYGAVICALVGIAKGVNVILDYHREFQDEE